MSGFPRIHALKLFGKSEWAPLRGPTSRQNEARNALITALRHPRHAIQTRLAIFQTVSLGIPLNRVHASIDGFVSRCQSERDKQKGGVRIIRRILPMLMVTVLMAVMLVTTAGAALADAKPNEHNCNAVYFSGGSEDVKGGAQGEHSSSQGQRGIRGDVLKNHTDAYANCGNNH